MSKQKTPLSIAVAARKGGVGKTTIAAALASLFALDRDALLVDFDPQSSTALALGLDPAAPGTGEALQGKPYEVQRVARLDRLQVMAGGAGLESPTLRTLPESVTLDRLEALQAGRVLVMDCPPGGGLFEDLAIKAAEVLLVVTEAHPLAVAGIGRVLACRRKGQRVAVVLNKVDNRRKLDRDAAEQLGKFLGVPVFTVHNAAEVSHAAAQGIPLALAKKCKPIDDLKALIKWIEK
jgi:chromosome partitioning protein